MLGDSHPGSPRPHPAPCRACLVCGLGHLLRAAGACGALPRRPPRCSLVSGTPRRTARAHIFQKQPPAWLHGAFLGPGADDSGPWRQQRKPVAL